MQSRDQVDRYKSLLQKQSDIMIALTTRLNERDEAIMQLQEELDALDAIHRESENGRARLTRRIGRLEEFIADRGLEAPEVEENAGDDLQKVRVGECETFNVTYGNLNPTDEKFREVINLAERRKDEIEELKDKVRNLESEVQNKTHSQHIESTRHSHEDISVIASSVNEIIMKLSQQNSPDVLKHVAKKLLDLQKLTTDIISGR
jgi:leucyl aminopeptidase